MFCLFPEVPLFSSSTPKLIMMTEASVCTAPTYTLMPPMKDWIEPKETSTWATSSTIMSFPHQNGSW